MTPLDRHTTLTPAPSEPSPRCEPVPCAALWIRAEEGVLRMRDVYKKRGSSVWYATIVQGRKRVQWPTGVPLTGSKKLAREKARQEQARFEYGGRAVIEVSLEAFLLEYEKWAAVRKRPSTVRGERGVLARFRERWGSLRLGEIDETEVNRYVADRRAGGVKKRTINAELSVLAAVMRLALQERRLKEMMWLSHRVRFGREDDSETREAPSWGDVVTLLENCGPEIKLFAQILGYTGLRRSAAAALDWSWFDLDKRTLHVPAGVMKAGRALDLPLSQELVDILAPLARPEGLLFQEHRDTLYQRVRSAMVEAGIYRRECGVCQGLRRAFGTQLIEEGADPVTVQRLMGHSRIETTLRHYVRPDQERQRAAVERRSLRRGRVVVPFKKEG